MRAVVYRGVGDIRLEKVPDPKIQKPTDALVRLTASAICGTDLHMVRGTMAGMVPGTVLGHEGVELWKMWAAMCVTSSPETAWLCHPRLHAETVLIAAPAIIHNATTPIPTARKREQLSMAVPN